ncbi:hypothetical protein LRY58_01140 [Candidatus Woesebacteria bacterium]|nr:hypothetical protein [Candidatus Woesebacteria bacterium]
MSWKQWWWGILLATVMVLGIALRAYAYWEFPIAGETTDEVAWTMLGSSVLQTGFPQSWSYFSAYTDVRDMYVGDVYYRVVAPVVDHPPLFALIPGGIQTIVGRAWDTLPSIKLIRFPMILLGGANIILFAWWLQRVWGKSIRTFVAVVLFNTVPIFVFLSRLVVSENLLLTFFLLTLVGLSAWKQSWGKVLVFLSLFLMPLTKLAGIALAIGVLVGSIQMVKKRELFLMAAAFVAGLGSMVAYMVWWDPQLFWQVQFGQATRDVGFLTLYVTQFGTPTLVQHFVTDYWTWLGYFVVFATLLFGGRETLPKEKKWHHFLHMVFFANLSFLLLSIGEQTVHGWYRIIFFPLFAFYWGDWAEWWWKTIRWKALSLLWLLLIFLPRNALRGVVNNVQFWETQSLWARIWVALAGVPILAELSSHSKKLARQWPWQRIWQACFVVVLLVVIFSNMVRVVTIRSDIYWEDDLYIETGTRS